MTWRELAAAGHVGDAAGARAALDDPDPVARQLALGALDRLRQLKDDQVRHALHDPDPGVRRRAVLLAAGRPQVSMLTALDDPQASVVEAAAFVCGERPAVDEATFARLCALGTGSEEPLVREAAVAALGALGDPRGRAVVLRACGDRPAVRRRAVLALAAFDGSDVESALRAALDDHDWQVRQAAEDVLRAGASDV